MLNSGIYKTNRFERHGEYYLDTVTALKYWATDYLDWLGHFKQMDTNQDGFVVKDEFFQIL